MAEVYGDLAPEDWFGRLDCLHPDDSGYDNVTHAVLGGAWSGLTPADEAGP